MSMTGETGGAPPSGSVPSAGHGRVSQPRGSATVRGVEPSSGRPVRDALIGGRAEAKAVTETGPLLGPLPAVIGHTPMVRLDRVVPSGRVTVYAKQESSNPGGSIKDRPARAIIAELLRTGELVPGESTVIESSSGNFAISVAMLSRYYGFRFVCVLDARTTAYNISILEALGAEIVMIDAPDAETGDYLPARLRRVAELMDQLPGAIWPDQYSNPHNAAAHSLTMEEIIGQVGRRVDATLVPTSSCGTLRGCSDYLLREGLDTELIAVDALGSAIFAAAKEDRMVPGHGSAITPELCALSMETRLLRVDNVECVRGCWELARCEGLLVGGSSGATWAAFKELEPQLPDGAVAVLVFPDRGERYLDSVYDPAWVERNFGREFLEQLEELGRPANGAPRCSS